MVARSLAIMGVSMGIPVPPPPRLVNYEDPEFVQLLHGKSASDIDLQAALSLIDRRNERDVWGFKLPMALGALELLSSRLRNPHFIFVFRGPLCSALRENIAVDLPILERIRFASEYYTQVASFLERAVTPCLLVSYEKAILNPELFCQALAKFIKIAPTLTQAAQMVEQIKPNHPEYLSRVIAARKELGLDT